MKKVKKVDIKIWLTENLPGWEKMDAAELDAALRPLWKKFFSRLIVANRNDVFPVMIGRGRTAAAYKWIEI